jgi:hypothetical protein
MNLLTDLVAVWGLVTGALIVLYICRSRLESKETDWIPLTDDAREDQAIKEQTIIGKKAHKFDWPIHALGVLSVVLLLVIIGYFVYSGITSQPPQTE